MADNDEGAGVVRALRLVRAAEMGYDRRDRRGA